MPNYTQWIKIALLIISSLEIIVLAVSCMSIAWLLATPTPKTLKGIAVIFAGSIGFTLGSVIFWRISAKFSNRRRAPKR